MPYNESYVAKIRKYIGHDFNLVMPTIDVIIEQAGKLMLIYNRDFDGWSFPGGYVEPEMAWAENASREAQEESGLIVNPDDFKLIGSISGKNYRAKYPNGDETQLFTNVFLASVIQKESNNIDQTEIDAKKWMAPDEIEKANLTFYGQAVYDVYKKYQATGQTQIIAKND